MLRRKAIVLSRSSSVSRAACHSACAVRPRSRQEADMFITKKHLSRRTLLRGGTAAIGLPLLSAMVPAATALAQTAAAPKPRMGFFYLPHGAIMNNTRFGAEMNRWTPDKVGRDFDFKPILEPFKPLQK